MLGQIGMGLLDFQMPSQSVNQIQICKTVNERKEKWPGTDAISGACVERTFTCAGKAAEISFYVVREIKF